MSQTGLANLALGSFDHSSSSSTSSSPSDSRDASRTLERFHPYPRVTNPLRNRRLMRLSNYNVLEETVKSKVSFEVQNILLRELELKDPYLYGNLSHHDGLMLFLYYMIEYQSFSKLDKFFGLPHSNAKQV